MQEKPETLLEETSELLGELIPIAQRNIDALQQNPNPLLQHLQHLIGQEIERQEGLLQQVEKMKERIHNHLNPPEPVPEQDELENPLRAEILRKGKRCGNCALRVIMPNGELIQCPYMIDTFVEVIRKLDVERVEGLGIEINGVRLIDTDIKGGRKRCGGYYILNVRNTKKKIAILKEICDGLGIRFKEENFTQESVFSLESEPKLHKEGRET